MLLRFSGELVHKNSVHYAGLPEAQGLYDPANEHDACGVGFVAHVKGSKSHAIVRQALQVLINLQHRGACGCEANTGDGAGILIQMPDRFFRAQAERLSIDLPPAGSYGAGLIFLPVDPDRRQRVKAIFERIVVEEGQRVLGWRDVPTDNGALGASAVAVQPAFEQVLDRPRRRRRTRPTRAGSSGSCTSSASASSTPSTRCRPTTARGSTSSASRRRR